MRRLVTVLASVSLLVGLAPVVTPAAAGGDGAARGVEVPEIDWRTCQNHRRFDCARVPVPLDHDDPDGPEVRLALTRLPASNPARRIGSIFTNPGGPGGSGVGFIQAVGRQLFSDRVRARFDIIGFDPRGVARSRPLECFETVGDFLDVIDGSPFAFPVTRSEERRWIETDRLFADACVANAGPIIDHMSTANVARDMDLLRRAVGDDAMTYYGVSYGSAVGSTYASMFPERVRAVAIDGIIDPISYATGRGDEALTMPVDARLKSEQGAWDTLRAFFRDCDAAGDACAFSAGSPRRRFDRLAARLRRDPIELPDGEGGTFPFGYADLVSESLGAMYSPFAWADYAEFLRFVHGAAAARRIARSLLELHAALGGRAPYSQTFEGFLGVWCSDSDNPDDPQAWSVTARAADVENPYFGRPWIWGSSACASWPGVDGDRYIGPFDVATANDVLIIGTRNDPATRYQDAKSTARIMPDSRLLTLEASGHTSLFLSRCVDRHLNRYLLRGAVPDEGTVCQTDVDPFGASPRAAAARAAAAYLVPATLRPTR